jgi:DNA repair protein RecO (recombination protein O)
MPQIIKTKALILGSMRWKESSKIVTLFTVDHGKIKVIARGALRNKSPFSGKLESLNYAEVIINEKKSRSLQILNDIDIINSFNNLRMQYDHMPYAMAILEIIQQIFENEFNDEVFFNFAVELLYAVEKSEYPETVLWYFLLKLSSYLGFRPVLSMCASCKKTNFLRPVKLSIENGRIYCHECPSDSLLNERLSPQSLSILQRLQHYPHKKIAAFTAPTNNKQNITALLIRYLNFHLDKQLTVRSLQLLI